MQDYAGDVDSLEAWNALSATSQSVLVDVRTRAELEYVGLPDLDDLEKQVVCVEWQIYPLMSINEGFTETLLTIIERTDAGRQPELFFLCRSGVRSKAAAIAMTNAGIKRCFNVTGGFEGRLNESGQRGLIEGWKFEGLPWRQG